MVLGKISSIHRQIYALAKWHFAWFSVKVVDKEEKKHLNIKDNADKEDYWDHCERKKTHGIILKPKFS